MTSFLKFDAQNCVKYSNRGTASAEQSRGITSCILWALVLMHGGTSSFLQLYHVVDPFSPRGTADSYTL